MKALVFITTVLPKVVLRQKTRTWWERLWRRLNKLRPDLAVRLAYDFKLARLVLVRKGFQPTKLTVGSVPALASRIPPRAPPPPAAHAAPADTASTPQA